MNVPVVIVGAGPTGLTAATLLGQHGVESWSWSAGRRSIRYRAPSTSTTRSTASLPAGPRRRSSPRSPGPAAGCAWSTATCGCSPSSTATGTGRHGYPQANMFDQPDLEGILRRNLARYASRHPPRQREVTDVTQDGADRCGSRSPTGPPAATSRPRRVRAGLRRRQQHDPRRDRRHDAGPQLRAALAGRRRRHRRRPRPVGWRAPALRPAPRRHLHAGRRRPATAGSSGCSPARPPTTSATWPGCTR